MIPSSAAAASLPAGIEPLTLARIVMVLAGVSILTTAWWVYERNDGAALRPFVALLGVVGCLAIADGVAAGFANWLSVVWLSATVLIPVAFGMFVVEYYGLPYLGSRTRQVAFLTIPVLGIVGGTIIIFEPSANGAMVAGVRFAGATTVPDLVITVSRMAERAGLYYAGGVMIAASAVMLRTANTYEHLDSRLGVLLPLTVAWPWLAYMATPALVVNAWPVRRIVATTATGYVLSAGVALFIVTRGGLFDAAPAAGTLGPETVLSNLDDPVIVVDREDRIVRINQAVSDTFGVASADVVGQPISSVLGVDIETLRDSETLELSADGESRHFEASVSPVTDRRGRSPGKAVVVSDVTDQRVRAQRLAVLNRVLRHNLRNEMTSIVGRARMIVTEADEHADTARGILTSAEDLVDLGDRAQEVEEMMSLSGDGPTTADVAAVSGDVARRYRAAHQEADVSVDVDDSLEAGVDPRILSRVLDNLIENAIVHNDAPTPVVVVSARMADESDDVIRLTVSDNGPGLPEQERTSLQQGDESPLRHSSGLGLWAVSWGVTRMGGTLSFDDNEPHGTVVTIRLPVAGGTGPGTEGLETVEGAPETASVEAE